MDSACVCVCVSVLWRKSVTAMLHLIFFPWFVCILSKICQRLHPKNKFRIKNVCSGTTRETPNDDLEGGGGSELELITRGTWTSNRPYKLYLFSSSLVILSPSAGASRRRVHASQCFSFLVLWCLTGKEMFFTSWMSRKEEKEGLGVAEICWVQSTAKLESDTQTRLCLMCFLAFGSCSKVFLLFGLNKHLPTKWKFASLSVWKHSRHKVLREREKKKILGKY